MDSELTPRRKAEGVMTRWKSGLGVGEPGLIDAITTAIQKQSNEDLERHRAKRAALEAELAAANERCAELAAALEKTDQAFEMFAAYQGGCCCEHISTDETAPGECVLCDIDRGARQHGNPSAILAAVREKARREGAAEELRRWAHWGEDIRRRIAELEGEG